ncbi:hypothetical protein [Streptomyces sp. NPDC017230]|uniref:hypothetical protein n=1 Tax=unclassified Streptomyces TaxID=2593676 RepID=UPI0037954348
MEPADLLTRHSIDPAHLEAASAPPACRETLARVQAMPPRPCSVCGDHARTARAVDFPDAGPRRVDLCRGHGLAVMRRLPHTMPGEIFADLRAAAAEAGLVVLAVQEADAARDRWPHEM